MDFSFDDNFRDLAELTRTILHGPRTPARLAEVEATGDRFDRALWTDLAKAGVLSAALPESVGGSGLGLLEQCAVLVELGKAVAPVPYLPSIVQAASAIAEFGTDAQRADWAAPAADGELVLTAALSEEVGDDPARPTTTADTCNCICTLASARDEGRGPGRTGRGPVSCSGRNFRRTHCVSCHAEGFRGDRPSPARSSTATPKRCWNSTTFHSARTACSATRRRRGRRRLARRARHGRPLRALRRASPTERLQMTATYATSRVQFDRPIATFQAVGQRLADCYIDAEAIRLTLWQAAWRLSKNLPAHNEIATAKFWAADGGHRIAHAAVHVHGGMGIDVDYPLHRYFVAAKRIEFSLGGATTQLRRIGIALAAEPA